MLRLRTASAHESSVLKGGAPAIVVYVVASLAGAEVDSAAAIAVYFTVFLLAGVGYLGAHQAGLRGRAMLLEVAGAASFGLLIVGGQDAAPLSLGLGYCSAEVSLARPSRVVFLTGSRSHSSRVSSVLIAR